MVVLAVASGVVWLPIGIVISTIESLRNGRGWLSTSEIVGQLPLLFTVGAVCGFFFSILLSVGARKQTFARLTLLRVSVLGGLGAAAVPFAIAVAYEPVAEFLGMLPALAVYWMAGALTAGGLLVFARRATDPDNAPPLGRGDADATIGSGTA